MRTITLYPTYGKHVKVETEVTTWGELEQIAIENGIDTSTLLATESVNKTDLNHKEAKLPEGNFVVFFRKKDTKAGLDIDNMSYRELREEIRQHIFQDENAKAHFEADGKSYTNKSTQTLRELLSSYLSQEEEVAEETSTDTASETVSSTIEDIFSDVKAGLEIIKEALPCDSDSYERAEVVLEELEGLGEMLDEEDLLSLELDTERVETEEEREARELAEMQRTLENSRK